MNKENDETTKSFVNALARTVATFVAEVLYNVKIILIITYKRLHNFYIKNKQKQLLFKIAWRKPECGQDNYHQLPHTKNPYHNPTIKTSQVRLKLTLIPWT